MGWRSFDLVWGLFPEFLRLEKGLLSDQMFVLGLRPEAWFWRLHNAALS